MTERESNTWSFVLSLSPRNPASLTVRGVDLVDGGVGDRVEQPHKVLRIFTYGRPYAS